MTRLVAFQTPHDLWCFSCDSNGIVLQAFPSSVQHYIGKNIDEVKLIAASILRYLVEKINDSEYPTSFDVVYADAADEAEVKQNGLRMRYAEEYGKWNKETNQLDIRKLEDADKASFHSYCAVATPDDFGE